SSRRRHTRCYRDWSSDVCSSDLETPFNARSTSGSVPRRPSTSWRIQWVGSFRDVGGAGGDCAPWSWRLADVGSLPALRRSLLPRSEERRVGKECRYGWLGRVMRQ